MADDERAPLLPAPVTAQPPRARRTVTFNDNPVSKTIEPDNWSSRSYGSGSASHRMAAAPLGGISSNALGLNAKLRRRNAHGIAGSNASPSSTSALSSAVAGQGGPGGPGAGVSQVVNGPKIGPQRSTKTAQKLKELPLPDFGEEGPDEESGREVYSQYTRIKNPKARRDAARLGKADRDRLPRVTAYCTANRYQLDSLMRWLKQMGRKRGTNPKRIDECLYTPFSYTYRRDAQGNGYNGCGDGSGSGLATPADSSGTQTPVEGLGTPVTPLTPMEGGGMFAAARARMGQEDSGLGGMGGCHGCLGRAVPMARGPSADELANGLREAISNGSTARVEDSNGNGEGSSASVSGDSSPILTRHMGPSQEPLGEEQVQQQGFRVSGGLRPMGSNSGYSPPRSTEAFGGPLSCSMCAPNGMSKDNTLISDHNAELNRNSYFDVNSGSNMNGPHRHHQDEPTTPTAVDDNPDLDITVGMPEIFLFDYGVVVMWGMTAIHETRLLREISRHSPIERLSEDQVEIERFNFYYTREYQARIYNDFIALRLSDRRGGVPGGGRSYTTKLAISHGLAQSVKTNLYEELIAKELEGSKDLPAQIALAGKMAMSRTEVNMKIGKLFILRIQVHLNGSVLDTPELFWTEPELEPVYQATRRYLEMDQRIEVLGGRLEVIGDLLSVLKDQGSQGHGEMLEWIVIVLIAAEIVVAVVNIIVDVYAGVE